MRTVLGDAWEALVPARGDPHGPLSPLLLVLTVVTGIVDAFSYLVLGHVFVANMTGNVVFVGFALAGAKGFSLGASVTALGAFAVGAHGSGHLRRRWGARRGVLLAITVALEVVLFGAATALAWSTEPTAGASRYLLIVMLGAAMGLQNGTARHLAVPDLTTTVLTLTITGIAADSRLSGGPGSKIGRRGLSALAMLAGALGAAGLVVHVSKPACLLIATVLLAGVALAAATLVRSGPDWDRVP
jgi:uncharacterized membrane protein YoaK (UPF0700 family)